MPMNDRQFYAIKMPARTLEASTSTDYQDMVRSPSGAVVLTALAVEIFTGHPRWHAVAIVVNPHTRTLAKLEEIPLRLHRELKTIVAKLTIGVGKDPSDIHPSGLGWHCMRLCTVDEIGMIPEPPPEESKLFLPNGEPVIVRPVPAVPELEEAGFKPADLVPSDIDTSKPTKE